MYQGNNADHHALSLQNRVEKGTVFQITGSIAEGGMTYEVKNPGHLGDSILTLYLCEYY